MTVGALPNIYMAYLNKLKQLVSPLPSQTCSEQYRVRFPLCLVYSCLESMTMADSEPGA